MQKALYIVCLLILGYSLSPGQAKLAIDSASSNPADTLYYNQGQGDTVIEWTVNVVNIGNAAINGTISVRAYHNEDYAVWYEKAEIVVNNFEVGQSQIVNFKDTVQANDPRYKGGNNILVIWPHSDAAMIQAPDSTNQDIWINGLVNAEKPELFSVRVEAGPNPVTTDFNLRFVKDQHKLEYVRVVNTAGQVVREYGKAIRKVEFGGLPEGLYFVEIRFNDGVAGTYRILKTN